VPSRKEIKWSQLKVGTLVLVAIAILIFLIFLMSGSTGGLFAPKLMLRTYFDNASNLKNGAPVTLEGVTIGNVTRIRVVPSRSPKAVEVTMRIGEKSLSLLHTDSTTVIAQAGVLGDSFVDITSKKATGPPPANNSELKSVDTPSIQEVVNSSQLALTQITGLMGKIDTLFDTLNSKKGTAGKLMNDPQLYNNLSKVTSNLEIITRSMAKGEGTLGKLIHDDALYQKLNSSVDRLNNITNALDEGKGTAGKLLRDDSLYKNLNQAVANTNQLVGNINAGKGALGKLASDQEFANRLNNTVSNLDELLKGINEGKGTLGQLAQNRSLYNHTDQTMDQAQQLVKAIRENPRKYLVIQLKIF
jgi:phospholipid/cholesterol/gamma-HCH transport system substrate-binding protein